MSKKVKNPHDLAFKRAMTDIRVARGFLKQFLPEKLQAAMDMRTLKLSSNNFVTKDLEEKMSDVVYKAQINGKPAYICFIIEHQSTPERWMAYRLFGYTWHVIEQYHRQYPKQKLPLVYSLVVYNGKRPFKYPTDIRDLIAVPRSLVDEAFPNVFQLVDLTEIDDTKLRDDIWSGFLLLHFKHARNRDIVRLFKHILLEIAQHFVQTGDEEYVQSMLKYLVETTEATEEALNRLQDLVSTQVSHKLGEQMTTLAERLQEKGIKIGEERGIAKGRTEGRTEGQAETAEVIARNLLMEKVASVQKVAHITNLPVSVVVAIQKGIKG